MPRFAQRFRRRFSTVQGWPARRQPCPTLRLLVMFVFADSLLNGLYVPLIAGVPPLFWVADVLTHAVVPLALLWLSVRRGEVRLADLGIRATTDVRHGRIFLVVLLLAAPLASIIIYAANLGIAGTVIPGSRALLGTPWLDLMP